MVITMNIKLTISLLLLTLLARPLHADWKHTTAWAAGLMCWVTSYGFFTKAQRAQADLLRPQNSYHHLYAREQKRQELAACRIAAGFSFIAGLALVSIPYLQGNGGVSFQNNAE